jgi:hypothetical protein
VDRVSIDEKVGFPADVENDLVTPPGSPERVRATFLVDPERRFTVIV